MGTGLKSSTAEADTALDRIDRRLLDLLQRDGRLAIAELARLVDLTPTPCMARVRRLEREGLIRRYAARLNPQRLGLPVLAFVEIELDKTTPAQFEPFERMTQALPEVIECHMIAGGFDYLLKVRAKSMHAFRRFLGEKLTTLPGIAQTRTYFSLEEIKADDLLPVIETPVIARRRKTHRRRKLAS